MGNIILAIIGILVVIFIIYSTIAIKHVLIYKKINPRVMRLTWIFLIIAGGFLTFLLYTLAIVDWGSL